MTDRYFDWINGSDAANGLTAATAKKSMDVYRAGGGIAAGDRIFSKRGVTQYFSTLNIDVKAGSSDTARTFYGAYGESQIPYAIWSPSGGLNDYIVNGSGRSYIDYADIRFDMLSQVSYPVYMMASGATPNVGHKYKRCEFINAKTGQAGFLFGSTSTSTGDASNYSFEYCNFYDNPGHGAIVNGAHDVRFWRCRAWNNGWDAPFGGHGFSSKYRRTDGSSGWTQVGATTVWQRTLAAYETTVYYVRTGVGSYFQLTENTATPTTPSAGQFGQSAGVLYINVNSTSNPSGQSINYAWGRTYNIIFDECESFLNVSDPRAPSTEGHGFAFDDYVDFSRMVHCNSHDNAGGGFSFNQGKNNILCSSIGARNGVSGWVGATCLNAKIWHNTFIDNNQGESPFPGELTLFEGVTGDISNNIMRAGGNAGSYAVSKDATCVITGAYNNSYGYNAVTSSSTFTNDILDDPLLDSNLRPQQSSIIRVATFLGVKDRNRRIFANPSTIGAVEIPAASNRLTLSIR